MKTQKSGLGPEDQEEIALRARLLAEARRTNRVRQGGLTQKQMTAALGDDSGMGVTSKKEDARQRRTRPIPANVDSTGRAVVDTAVELWMDKHDVRRLNPETRGQALAAICWEWYRREG